MSLRILSIDGGGVRGVITSILLDRIEEKHPFLSKIDVFSGTSTGAIIAVALALGWSTDRITEFYKDNTEFIFRENFIDKIKDVDGLIASKYSNKHLTIVLKKAFGKKRLSDIPKKVVIHSFYIGDEVERPWTPYVMTNFGNTPDISIVEALLRSTAVPTYFPIYKGFIDGGVYCNNPSLSSLGVCMNLLKTDFNNIRMLSVGTGILPYYIDEKYHESSWGAVEWMHPLLNILLDGQLKATTLHCRNILNEKYHRIQPTLDKDIPLDSVSDFIHMKKIATTHDIMPHVEWVNRFT